MLRNRLPFAGLGFCLPLLASLLVAVAAAVAGASAAPGGKLQHAGGSFAAAKRAQARGFAAPAAVRLTRKRTNVAVARGTRAFGERPEWRRVPRPQPRRPEAPPAPRAPRTAKSLPGPPAAGAYRGRVGFTGSLVWYEEAEQLAWLRRLRETGVRWIREDFHWGAFEPDPGVWKWKVGDRLMRNASLAGVDVLGVVAYSADWAASGPTIYHPPRNPAAYAAFCRRVVERYGPGGAFWRANPDLAPRPLRALEIWNEPWHSDWWRPLPNPPAYARLVRAAAVAIHAADPSVKVLASADVFQMRKHTSQSLDWFRLLLQADAELFRTHVDAYSVHLYLQSRSPHDMSVEQRWRFDRSLITRDLAAAAGASHPLWVTEFGWTTNPSHPDSVSEATQALYVRQALERAVGKWGSFVQRSFIYHWGRPESDHIGGFGFFRADGSVKPARHTLHALLQSN